MTTTQQALERLAEVARDLRSVQPLVGHFLISAVGMTRSGELVPRQLAHAALSVANRLGPAHAPFRDQLRGAVQGVLVADRAPRLGRPAPIEQDAAP